MKVKKIRIEIKPLKESLKDFAETFGKIKRNEKVKPSKGVNFSNVNNFRKFFQK